MVQNEVGNLLHFNSSPIKRTVCSQGLVYSIFRLSCQSSYSAPVSCENAFPAGVGERQLADPKQQFSSLARGSSEGPLAGTQRALQPAVTSAGR